jgi:hypothetical protein
MPASDRDAVNQSHAKPSGQRTHVSQVPQQRVAVKTNTAAGRDAVQQSPQSKRPNN